MRYSQIWDLAPKNSQSCRRLGDSCSLPSSLKLVTVRRRRRTHAISLKIAARKLHGKGKVAFIVFLTAFEKL